MWWTVEMKNASKNYNAAAALISHWYPLAHNQKPCSERSRSHPKRLKCNAAIKPQPALWLLCFSGIVWSYRPIFFYCWRKWCKLCIFQKSKRQALDWCKRRNMRSFYCWIYLSLEKSLTLTLFNKTNKVMILYLRLRFLFIIKSIVAANKQNWEECRNRWNKTAIKYIVFSLRPAFLHYHFLLYLKLRKYKNISGSPSF